MSSDFNTFENYEKAWKSLEDYFKHRNTNDDYENKITNEIKPMIVEFVKKVAEFSNNKISIKFGIIQINSLITHKRILIPVVCDGEGENLIYDEKTATKVKLTVRKNAERDKDRQLMFLQPDEPKHLLTELMWRFNGEKKKVDAFVVLKDSFDDEIKKVINECESILSMTLKENSFDNKIELNEITNQLSKKIAKPPKVSFIYEEKPNKYSVDQCKNILSHTQNILFHNDPEKVECNHIFYVSDINETDYLAAFAFELNYTSDNNTTKLSDFISILRWYFSKYIVELISNAERKYASSDDIYRDVFFSKETTSVKGEYPAIHNFIAYLEPAKTIKSREIKKVLGKIKGHFSMAKSDNGTYWRGYKYYAYEVACTVAGIIDILFLDKGNKPENNGKLESIIREKGVGLEALDTVLKNKGIPYLFRQLFRGLEREKELFLLPQYRDHFIHSFYCFSFGLMLLNKKVAITSQSQYDNIHEITRGGSKIHKIANGRDTALLFAKKWFVVSMWHDIAYTLEKGNEIIENYILKFMDPPKRQKKVLPWIPNLGHLIQIENILDEIKQISKNGKELFNIDKNKLLKKDNRTIDKEDIVLAVAFDDINHGIWSSLFVNHVLSASNKRDNNLKKITRRNIRHEICKAILPHHLATWKVDEILADFGIKLEQIGKWEEICHINPRENPLGYLLVLCDIFCQAGREAPEMSEDRDNASNMQIKFDLIKIQRTKIFINIAYTDDCKKNDSQRLSDLESRKDEFFIKPLKCLEISKKSRDDLTIKLISKVWKNGEMHELSEHEEFQKN